ncbi:glycosyltransferase family 2 protein [Alicyclobacillus tolerans]|uniref:glycosyltransferase family 2 protein n=1 Tax=Alicyclobacillus tolerans TaxID=90970 RepID=UPI003B815805
MPVYNVGIEHLEEAINSVVNQTYPNWELCIYDDNSTDLNIKTKLKELEKTDKRINVKFGDENKGISIASNEAIKMSSGEYICFLDHDDLITVNALFEIAKVLQKCKWDLIYTNEDKINLKGKFCFPFYKKDWCVDLLLKSNYITHFSCYKKEVGEEIGWFRKGYEGSQDYDLVLRFSKKNRSVYHIKKVLYHWRMTEQSTALSSDNKPYAYDSAIRSLKEYYLEKGLVGEIKMIYPGHYIFIKGDDFK